MTEIAAQNAFEKHLITLADRPETVWVNKEGDGVPRLEVNHGPVSNTTITHRGGNRGELMSQVDIVVAANQGPDNGELNPDPGLQTYMNAVIAHFPFNMPLGNAKVTARPSASGMRPDGHEFRVSVTVTYRLCQ